MKKVFYFFLAFIVIYLGIFSGGLLAALYVYYEEGYFSLSDRAFLSPIKPAIYGLIIQLLVAKLLPSKNNGDKNDIEKR